ncbi:choice-of-anchor D domain-containing protein [Xanthomonadaceae bacterium XH05]|nr:choice-of-anchor D domain-containing protein [Xanthomonadaceae bacterium XH05]
MNKISRVGLGLLAGAVIGVGGGLPTAAAKGLPYEIVTMQPGAYLSAEMDAGKPHAVPAIAAVSSALPYVPMGQGYGGEVEPNGTSATATPLDGRQGVIRADVWPAADVDVYAIQANAGDRIYAATMTSFTSSGNVDTQLRVLASDGTTVIELDEDDGSMAAQSSSIAGATLPATGTYYLQVNAFSTTTTIRPYELHYRLQSGTPTPEVEPNDTPATANPLPANGWVSGTRSPAAATEQDWYSLSLNAGDSVFLSLDADPERDNVQWDGRLGFALFGDASNQILVVNDLSTGSAANPLSEALFITVKEAGTYFAFVDSASAAVGGPTATYHLSVTVHPAADEGVNCTTYTSTNVPVTLGPGAGLASSSITVPGNPRIADIDVSIQLNHALMQDLDVSLRSPSGNDVGLFTDIGANATGGQSQMDTVFDDEAAIPPTFTVLRGLSLKPELNYRLSWFDGENAGGTWTLDLRDDATNASGGTLTGWSMRICEPPPPPTCAAGFTPVTVYSTDFESGAAGFTSSGTANEWELGLPATIPTSAVPPVAAFNSCASGTNCWKTDLDGTYDANSSQDLLSPNINLAGLQPPVLVRWSHRYQMENASFDRYHVDFRQVGGASPVRLFEWRDGSMSNPAGNPAVNIPAASGWGQKVVRADALAGLNTELVFHVDSDGSVNYAGVAIDDVSVTACRAMSADLAITKTNGVTTSTPGGSTTYTITSSNTGPDPVAGATVADTFPASLTCTWTCVGAGGGTCTAAGSGNINDTVNLPVGGSATHTATCTISASATGTLSNTATVSSSITDPTPANNSATDTDTLTPQADLSITKTDGVTTVTPGGSTTYTITASNNGPSNAPGATVADAFPAALTCTWTCMGAGGGTCTAVGSGNISDTVNLPAGGSVTYTASCAISGSASGTLSNTATVAAPAGVTDPAPGNNAATDTDTVLAPGNLAITPASLAFGSVPVGSSSAAQSVTLANTGDISLQVTALTAATVPFALSGGTCGAVPITIAGGASCTVSYSFTPSAAGAANQLLTVTADAPGSGSISLNGTGVQGSLSITPTSLDFGAVAVGSSSAAQAVTLANTGDASLQVTALTAATAPFALSGGTCGAVPITIAGGASCTLSYTFNPGATGVSNQTLTVTADVPGSGSIALTGEGVEGAIGVLDATLDFGDQALGTETQLVLTITNTGSGPLDVAGISAVAAPFAQIPGGSCGTPTFTLLAGSSCTVLYGFIPTSPVEYSQAVMVSSDVGEVTVVLTGSGLQPAAVLVPAGGAPSLLLLALAIFGFAVLVRQRA